ncbi:hypothetical protein ACFXMT_21050 [Streptomyces mirabilis]|uniref:hypothetical protein n=1 Tax=Streptomyces mirabilis TaxID=68239 RepID=UPI0036CB799C
MWRPDRGTLRSAGFVLLLTGVFVMVNSQVVYAASSSNETGDLLSPLNITSSEGVPINGYELSAEGGSIVAFRSQALAFALSGLFTLIRLLVGLAGWAIELAFRFPLLKILIQPAQKVADSYTHVVVDTLGIKGLLLAWAFVFAGFMIVRGRVGRGLGEIFLTLLIAAFAASAFVRPDYLLTQDGPLGQAQQVAAEVAQQSVNSYDWGGKLASRGPCDGMAGNQELKCLQQEGEGPVSAAEVARPIQDSITNALIVKPYMLLEYGRILDPAKAADRTAYAVHLKWITGGYKASAQNKGKGGKDDPCRRIRGEAKKYCERSTSDVPSGSGSLPALTPGGELLDASNAIVTDDDREFSSFLADMKRAGPVGKACAAYAEKPTWWRVSGAGLLLIAALFICGMLLSSAIVLLGTQGICAAAAAAGGVTFIAGMLPGPARQSVWKWLSLWGIAILALVGICAFVPFFGIAVDATVTNGPDLMVERILLIDVLAIAGAAGHRRLLTGITSFGRRMAMRMRYAKVGGTHMPGDTSELGAALAMNSPAAMGGYGGGLRAFTGGGGRFGMLGTRQRLMGALASLVDGAGMPVDTGGLLADATAEAGRGLAPLTAAAAVGGLGARLGTKGAHWLLIGRRPDMDKLLKWRKPTADGDPGGSPGAGPGGSGSGGPLRPGRRPQLGSGAARPEHRPHPAVHPRAQPAGPLPRLPPPAPRRPCRLRSDGRPARYCPRGAVGRLALLPGRPPASAGVGQHRPRRHPGLGRHGVRPQPSAGRRRACWKTSHSPIRPSHSSARPTGSAVRSTSSSVRAARLGRRGSYGWLCRLRSGAPCRATGHSLATAFPSGSANCRAWTQALQASFRRASLSPSRGRQRQCARPIGGSVPGAAAAYRARCRKAPPAGGAGAAGAAL